ncbi:MAG TPA: type VI secretion system membrane subunit TssM [Rhodothermales bacterium]|nr:type VI secretion system membrane subunit TssM [Rhodothermales bacterium]
MGRISNVVKSGYFLAGVGVVLAVAAILVIGAWLAWSTAIQLLAIIGVLVLCILLLAVSMLRSNKNASLIEQSLKTQGKQQHLNTRPDKRADIEDLQKQFDTAIQRLKQSKLGRGRSGKAALHALPWYLFIGPPGTGKTTAIINSGLNFPIGTNRIRGVGGTRNCDWFFTDSAILLDTAGRYVTESEDAEEWQAFLETLKKYRPERPINGIIVGISLDTLADASYDEIEWHAATIRERIDELLGQLGVRFPVYLLFTKCDLLEGFTEFFGELARKEREQIWGCTLDQNTARDEDIPPVFEQEFDKLYDAMLNVRAGRLSRAMKRDERRKVYTFPLQFASVKENLSFFVSRLFQPNPYQEAPVFRGFYFTSGTQEGAPIDHVIEAIARQFDLGPATPGDSEIVMETKSYFIKDLFTDVIVPDQFMVQQTSRAAMRGRLVQAGTAVGALVLLGLFILAISQALVRSKSDLGHLRVAATQASTVLWRDPASLSDGLSKLDGLREQVAALEHYEDDPPLLRLGLYRGGTVLPPARNLYLSRMRDFFERTAFAPVQQRLEGIARSTLMPLPDGERDSLYNDTRAYLLLTSEWKRLKDEDAADLPFLNHYLSALVSRNIMYSATPGDRGAFAEQLREHVSAFTAALGRGTVAPFGASAPVVTQLRRIIYEPPGPDRIYEHIKEAGEAALPPFTLSDALQGQHLELFAQVPEVPGLYTKRGWETYVQDAIQRETASPERADWVMGYTEAELPESMQDQQRLADQLRNIYFSEYAAAWEHFLRGIKFRQFRDLNTAGQAMSDLGSPYDSPILYILAHVAIETQFDEGVAGDLKDRLQSAATRKADTRSRRVLGKEGAIDAAPQEEPLNLVELKFKRLHDLGVEKAQSGGASPAVTRAMENLGKVGEKLNELAGNRAKAVEYARQIESQDGGELASLLIGINSSMGQLDPDVREALFEEPIIYAWETIVQEAQRQLNQQWTEQVVRPFQQKIFGRYPIDPKADQEIPIGDFEDFFQPQTGVLASFWTTNLAPFVSSNGRGVRSWNGRGVQISEDVLNTYDRARQIGAGLFDGGVLTLAFDLQPDIPAHDGNAPAPSQVEIDVQGSGFSYGMGSNRPWTQIVWPGRPGASLRLITQSGSPKVDFSGDWAWFRMLQAATVHRRSSTEYELNWPFPNGVTARYNLRTRSSVNPFNDVSAFFAFRLPASLN